MPHAVFNDTFLGKKLADGNKTKIPDNLIFYQNGTDPNKSNSDALQQVIAGNVTSEEYFHVASDGYGFIKKLLAPPIPLA